MATNLAEEDVEKLILYYTTYLTIHSTSQSIQK